MDELKLRSSVTCPHCGHRKQEEMPADACQFFYDCSASGEVLKPELGDCYVYCSYGTVPYKPMQTAHGNFCC